MTLSKPQLERVHQIHAWCVGQCVQGPLDMMTDAEKKNKKFVEAVDELVFYCENCSWYCDADERHIGDLCDDCHDERTDE